MPLPAAAALAARQAAKNQFTNAGVRNAQILTRRGPAPRTLKSSRRTSRVGQRVGKHSLLSKSSVVQTTTNAVDAANAVAVSYLIGSWGLFFYFTAQLPLLILSYYGLVHESFVDTLFFGWLNWLSAGDQLFVAVWYIIAGFGLLNMLMAAAVYSWRGVDCFKTQMMIVVFAISLIGYCFVFINLIPWVVIWAAVVAFSHVRGIRE